MSSLVRATVPTDEFVLSETFERVPTAEFDALRVIGDEYEGEIPLLWAKRADPSTVREALQADETTDSVELVSRRDRDSLFRIRWTARSQFLTDVLVGEGAAIVSARGTSDGWRFRLLFPEHDDISTTYGACGAYDVSIDRIRSLEEAASFEGVQLTDTQFTTLETALESGYYGVPRDVTLDELAAELGVSHQALSERLRRGHRTLVEAVLGL